MKTEPYWNSFEDFGLLSVRHARGIPKDASTTPTTLDEIEELNKKSQKACCSLVETEIIEMDLSTQRTGELINEFELLTQKLISIQSHLIAITRPKSCRVTVPLVDTTPVITIPSREEIDSFMTDERND